MTPDYNELYQFYAKQLERANREVAKDAVIAGYASPWLKVQLQMLKLMLACKKELDSDGTAERNATDALTKIGF